MSKLVASVGLFMQVLCIVLVYSFRIHGRFSCAELIHQSFVKFFPEYPFPMKFLFLLTHYRGMYLIIFDLSHFLCVYIHVFVLNGCPWN